jgi:hypothetical protein
MEILIFLSYKNKGDAISSPPPYCELCGCLFGLSSCTCSLYLRGSAWDHAASFFVHVFLILQKKLAMFFEFKFFFIEFLFCCGSRDLKSEPPRCKNCTNYWHRFRHCEECGFFSISITLTG